MSRILEHLFENIGFFIIIGGVVLTMLSRLRRAGIGGGGERPGNGDGRPAGRQNPMMPSFGGGPNEGTGKALRSGPPERGPSRQVEALVDAKPLRVEQAPQPRRERDYGALSKQVEPTSPIERADSGAEEPRLSPSEAMRGMMWAEILSPPRAKRPYGRRDR